MISSKASHAGGAPSLDAISDRMTLDKPVFIMGAKRSGTSLLYRTLQKHPVFKPHQTDLTETALFKKANKSYHFTQRQPWQLINYMLKDQEQYDRFLETIRSLQRRQQFLDVRRIPSRIFRRHPLTHRWWWLTLGSHLVARSYFYFARICTFLNVSFIEKAVVENNPEPGRWAPDPHLFGAIVAKTKDWQDHMSHDKARVIEQSLAPTMAALDYEPYMPAAA